MKNIYISFLLLFFPFVFQPYAQTPPLNYPLKIGDQIEYIVEDSITIEGELYKKNFSFLSTVEKDTLLQNGKTYKKISYKNISNYSNGRYWEEYLLSDSLQRIYEFYDGQEYLLYDYTLPIGSTYETYPAGFYWEVVDIYQAELFGNTVTAMEIYRKNPGGFIFEGRTIVNNYGLVNYSDLIDLINIGNIWAAKINGLVSGELTFFEQISWKDFFPLHIGDTWKYEGFEGSIPTLKVERIIRDSLAEGFTYYVKEIEYLAGTLEGEKDTVLIRIDSTGRIHQKFRLLNTSVLNLSQIVGDTTYHTNFSAFSRIEDKYFHIVLEQLLLGIEFLIYPDLTNSRTIYSDGLGKTYSEGELQWEVLTGAIINNIAYGDTTLLTSVEDDFESLVTDFQLYQNYPNPFNPVTKIKYKIPEVTLRQAQSDNLVQLKVYDVLGNEVATLVDEYKPAGSYEVEFNATKLSSGIYLYKLTAGDYIETKKMVVLK